MMKEFYLKVPLAALVFATGCAAAKSDPEPVPAPGTTVLYIVRHAEKVISNRNDPDPDISGSGQDRAKALAERLKTAGITRVIATEFKRTQETAAPLASAIGVQIEVMPASHNGDAEALAQELLSRPGVKTLVVSHSLTIAPLIKLLGGPRVRDLCENEYSDLFILYLPPEGQPQLVRQHYGPGNPMTTVPCGS